MPQRYAYLVIQRQSYRLPVHPSPPPAPAGSEDEPGIEFNPTQIWLRTELMNAAKADGYGSIDALMKSRRTMEAAPTPARVTAVEHLFSSGLLVDGDRAVTSLKNSKTIPNTLWDILGSSLEFPESQNGESPGEADRSTFTSKSLPTHTTVQSWALTVHTADAESRAIEVDPRQTPASAFPLELVLQTLEELKLDGWRVAHVSEDRGIDDRASTSFVIRQRYLLEAS